MPDFLDLIEKKIHTKKNRSGKKSSELLSKVIDIAINYMLPK